MGYVPQVVDIDGDGINDIVAGSYIGDIIYYKGTKDGFGARTELKQKIDLKDRSRWYEILFCNPRFGDFNGDGLLDAFIGGAQGARYMLNEGTKEVPFLGDRQRLRYLNGDGINVSDITESDIKNYKIGNGQQEVSNFKTHVAFLDWDNDGVGDLLVTSSYLRPEENAIDFFKGVETTDGIRFMDKVPLFTAADGSKAIPGSVLIPYFYDLNGDGALDILLGISTNKYDKNGNQRAKPRGCILVIMSNEKYK